MRVVFLGTPEFGRTILGGLLDAGWDVPLVVTQPDRVQQRRGRSAPEPSAVGKFAAEHGLTVLKPAKLATVKADLEKAKADIVVVASFGQLIPSDTLKLVKGRWVNVHASLLPKYRGASPIQQALLDGNPETGVTLMEVIPALDAGPVIATRTVKVSPADTAGTLSEQLAQAGRELTVETLPGYVAGKIKAEPQDDARATMTRTLTKDSGQIDWSSPAEYLERFIRAMQPWPGAWTTLDGQRLVVLRAAVDGASSGEPGTFTEGSPLRVDTGEGSLIIERLKPAGKPAMAGAEWLHGRRRAGRFGSS